MVARARSGSSRNWVELGFFAYACRLSLSATPDEFQFDGAPVAGPLLSKYRWWTMLRA